MTDTLISIIVPIFNSSSYLDKCIRSIIEQEYDRIEVVLIDDGSTDNSFEICEEWAKKDKRIILVKTSNNGQGSARNLGVSLCHGEYVFFVDSDDWIEKNTLSYLSLFFSKQTYDIICFSNDTSKSKNSGRIIEFSQPNIMFEHLLSHPGTGQSPCDKLFKKNLLVRYPFPALRAYEDAAVLYKIFSISNSIVYVDKVFYHYYQRDNSTMHQPFSFKNFILVDIYNEMFLFYKKHFKKYSKCVKRKLIGSIQYCVGEYYYVDDKEGLKSKFENTIKLARSLSYTYLNFKNKILLFLIKHNIKLYWHLYERRRKY